MDSTNLIDLTDISIQLPTHIVPNRYQISIKPIFPELDSFIGRCIIYFKSLDLTKNYVILNSVNLKFLEIYMCDDSNQEIPILSILNNPESERVKLIFERIPEYGYIEFRYAGIISTELTGVIKAKHDGQYVLYTQFEPHSARRCFPCFDEPNYKAIFEIDIVAPSNYIILSNSKPRYSVVTSARKQIYFEDTPKMSTYLVAFYIGHANSIHRKTKYGVVVRIYSVKHPTYSTFALDVAEKALDYLTELFDYKYPVSKLDLVAVPQFAAAAMENWGLVIFREKCLIPMSDSIEEKIRIAYVIAHELAHQWFGNLVTMKWWDDLWLNESFATWVGWHIVDVIFPSWNVWEHFYINENMIAMDLDALTNSHPIKVQIPNVNNANEIFDEISYSKGGSVLRMLIETIGFNDFIIGMRTYFKAFAYKNCTTDDLWNTLSVASKLDINSIMDCWLNKPGYPIIYFYRKNNKLKFYQKKFSYDKNRICTDIWHVPIYNLTLNKKVASIQTGGNTSCINTNATGYYRVNYQPELLEELIASNNLSNLEYAHILNDLFYLLKARLIVFEYYTHCVENIINQLSVKSNISISLAIAIIDRYFDIDTYNIYKLSAIYRKIIDIYVNKLIDNGILIKTSDPTAMYVRRIVIKYKILTDQTFATRLKTDEDTRLFIYRADLQNNTIKYHSTLKYVLDRINIESEQEDIANILGFVSIESDYDEILQLILTDKILNQYKINLIVSCGKNKYHNKKLWNYIRNNWSELYECFKNNQFGLNRTIQALENILDVSIVTDIENFFADKKLDGMQHSLAYVTELIHVNDMFVAYINSQLP